MLTKLYVNNYKSLVNFELQLDQLNLLLGENGSGKSTVFEVLWKIRRPVLYNARVEQIFEVDELTRWENLPEQTFELEVMDGEHLYRYTLVITHDLAEKRAWINREVLWWDRQPLVEFIEGMVRLYQENGTVGSEYPLDWSFSALATIPVRHDTALLTRFKTRLERLLVVHPVPLNFLTRSQSADEQRSPEYYLDNFVSWYRYLSLDQRFVVELTAQLREVIPDFDALSFSSFGNIQQLDIYFQRAGQREREKYRFAELSDGQRMLIILYTLLQLATHRDNETLPFILCLDEPENFVALREIQPWLRTLYDYATDGLFQVILISHHPEVTNYLLMSGSVQATYWFERGLRQPVRVTRITSEIEAASLLPAELMSRGWFPE